MIKILNQEVQFVGRRITVRRDKVIEPSGKEGVRDVVLHPGAVSIIAMPSPEEIVLIRQYRHATGEELIELPAGTLEVGEDPIDTARRELEEETGYVASEMTHRATYYTAPGFTNELMYLYEASGLTLRQQRLEDDEAIDVVLTRREDALKWMREGKIRDAKTLVGLMMTLGPVPS
jgi:ADP-ribose pyrophosphatase